MLILLGNEGTQELNRVGPENLGTGDRGRHQIFFQHRHPLAAASKQVCQHGPADAATDDEKVVGHEEEMTKH